MFYKEGFIRGIRFGKIFNRYLIDLSISVENPYTMETIVNPIFDFGLCFAVNDPVLTHIQVFGVGFWFRILGVSYEDVLLKNEEE